MISRSATYALRALTFMAAREPDEWSLNREIAAELTLPPQFLTKILRVLAAEGVLMSQRGRSGGFRLARPADQITLLDVVEPFDRLSDRRTCLLGQTTCSDENACPLHDQWRTISDSLCHVLRGWTLVDLTRQANAGGGFPRLEVLRP
jgi:Rrf2 family transcriptional regulator, iron-sulfur cluster assembly transcription factor